MKRSKLLCTIAGLALTCSAWSVAQEKGNWRAMSSTARSITGDIAIANEKISINFSSFPIAQIRSLEPAEISAAFDLDGAPAGSGNIYRLSIPATTKFLRKNTLCGADETQWMATYVAGHNLQLAFFSGPKMPVFTHEAIGSSTSLCGTFSYAK